MNFRLIPLLLLVFSLVTLGSCEPGEEATVDPSLMEVRITRQIGGDRDSRFRFFATSFDTKTGIATCPCQFGDMPDTKLGESFWPVWEVPAGTIRMNFPTGAPYIFETNDHKGTQVVEKME